MFEGKRTKYSWPVTFCGVSLFMFLIQASLYDRASPKGKLREIHGLVYVETKVRKENRISLESNGQLHFCRLQLCNQPMWVNYINHQATGWVDEDGYLFAVNINGSDEVKISDSTTQKEKARTTALIAIAISVASFINIIRRKSNGASNE